MGARDCGQTDLATFLIAHRAPLIRLELELLARAALPATTPLLLATTLAEAYGALDTHMISVALLEEAPDFLAFAEQIARQQPGLIVGWSPNRALGTPPPIGERLQSPVVIADIVALARRAAGNNA